MGELNGEKTHNFWGNIFKKDTDPSSLNVTDILKMIPIFQNLSKRDLKKVAGIIYDRVYQPGEFLFEKDQPGAAMYIIKKGAIKILAPGPQNEEVVLATLETGDFVGELALLDDSPRSASAMAVEKTEALAFFREDLNKLLNTNPETASRIFKELALIIGKRLKATNEQLFSRPL